MAKSAGVVAPATVPADPATVPPAKPAANETTVYVLGKLRIEDEKVSVSAVAGKNMILKLDKPAKLGNALTIGAWLNNSWRTQVDALLVNKRDPTTGKVASQSKVTKAQVEDHLTALDRYPKEVVNLLAELFTANIWITDLDVRCFEVNGVAENAFKFGIVVDFANDQNPDGLTLFGDVKLEQACLGIVNAPKDYDFTKVPTVVFPKFTLPEPAQLKKADELEKAVAADDTKLLKNGSDDPAPAKPVSDDQPSPAPAT
ncbi:MAG TPA: hypothetical protein VGM07_11195 [Stellaceae bacterium]|jgi:hypothetical protein